MSVIGIQKFLTGMGMAPLATGHYKISAVESDLENGSCLVEIKLLEGRI